jgi:hypothetical protein
MADDTNAGIPAAGGQLGGEASRAAAIKRLQRQQSNAGFQIKKQQSSGPNTGGSGLPTPEKSAVQQPGNINQSSTPEKPRRI